LQDANIPLYFNGKNIGSLNMIIEFGYPMMNMNMGMPNLGMNVNIGM